jgi:hypothetical protein
MNIKIYIKNIPVGRCSLGLPRPDLFENGSFSGAFSGATDLNVGRKIYGTKMAAAGVVGAPSGGIELVLSKFLFR